MTKMAEQRSFDIEFELGEIFGEYKNKARRQELNAKWYMQLAKQGYRRAQHRLGCMYAQGIGVPKNDIKAYAWCKISASQQSPRAMLHLKEIESRLPADKIFHARKLSRHYYETYVAPFAD